MIESRMEQLKDLTKRLIANSFRELMLTTPFEKITIKMVTDHANVIRPTFYNHFHDKYEVMEWLVEDEILMPARELVEKSEHAAAMHHIMSGFYEDRVFYRRCFEVVGQNGFGEMLSKKIASFMLGIEDYVFSFEGKNPVLTKQLVAEYYGNGMITVIRAVIDSDDEAAVKHFTEAYAFLATHTIFNLKQ